MTRKRDTCVLVGLPPGEFPVPPFDAVANCIAIRGVGTRHGRGEARAFAAEVKVRAQIHEKPLKDINTVFADLKAGKGDGRIVIAL